MQGYPVISHLVPSYPPKGYPRISQDIPRQDFCIGISHYKFSVLGYPGLFRDKYHIGLSRDIPGYPLGSFFQMEPVDIIHQHLYSKCKLELCTLFKLLCTLCVYFEEIGAGICTCQSNDLCCKKLIYFQCCVGVQFRINILRRGQTTFSHM